MEHIDLEKGKILHDGVWFSAEELAEKIQEKIRSGEMKVARLAGLLEELKTAMDSIYVLEARITISKDQYEKLVARGGGNDNECVRRAILAFIDERVSPAPPQIDFIPVGDEPLSSPPPANGAAAKGKKVTINCSKCNGPIEIDTENMPNEIRCPSCNARGMLKTYKNKPQFKDRYAG
ncbi:MAG: hypothetical protein ACOZBW_03070 [Thermodesulfobacteriota bacterium]